MTGFFHAGLGEVPGSWCQISIVGRSKFVLTTLPIHGKHSIAIGMKHHAEAVAVSSLPVPHLDVVVSNFEDFKFVHLPHL